MQMTISRLEIEIRLRSRPSVLWPYLWLTIRSWAARRRQRRALLELDDSLLRDIGVSRADASEEAAKPFWKA